MLGGGLCVPLLHYPRLPLQLHGVGVWYVPAHPSLLPALPVCQEQGSGGISQFAADTAWVSDKHHAMDTARQNGRDQQRAGAW